MVMWRVNENIGRSDDVWKNMGSLALVDVEAEQACWVSLTFVHGESQ